MHSGHRRTPLVSALFTLLIGFFAAAPLAAQAPVRASDPDANEAVEALRAAAGGRVYTHVARETGNYDFVLATGGGAVLSEQNRALLIGHGTVVYLRAAPQDLWQRTRHDRNRPLLQTPDPLAKLSQLFAERDPLYRAIAHVIVDTGNQSVSSLAHRLEQKLRLAAASRPADVRAPHATVTKTCAR